MNAWKKWAVACCVLMVFTGCHAGRGKPEATMHPADAQASWIFSNVWGDCPAAYEFVADGGASAIASDYCSGFTDFHVGISGRVVRFDAIGAVDAYVPQEGWHGRYASESSDRADIRIGKLIREEYDPDSTDEGCTRSVFESTILVTPVDGVPHEAKGVLSGGCP